MTDFNTISSMLETIKSHTSDHKITNFSTADLENLFDDAYYNAGTEGAEDIQEQIDNLTAGIAALKKEAEELKKQIEAANLKVEDKGNEAAEIANKINAGTAEYQAAVKKAAQNAVGTAINECKGNASGNFREYFTNSFKKQLKGTSINPNMLKQWFDEFDQLQSEISPVADAIDTYLGQISNIQSKLDTTNATINLLEKTKANLSTKMEGAYTNSDLDSAAPIFSGAKEAVANEILNGDYKTGLIDSSASADEIKNKWLGQKESNDGASYDKYRLYVEGEEKDSSGRVGNKELNSLGTALDNGMWEELQGAGMSNDEIMTWISTNWDVGLKKNDDGSAWVIPAGHGKSGHQETNSNYLNDATGSSKIYNKLEEKCKTESSNVNASSVDKDNISKLYDAMNPSSGDDILTKMYKNGFTFKEAMYVLTQTFPDSGITYDMNNQSGGRNYQIVDDTDATKSLYSGIKDKIKNYWNVDASNTTTSQQTTKTEAEKSDPITWQDGTKTYTLIVDRNADGKFNYDSKDNNDLLGSKNGIDELKALDTNGDGKVSAEEMQAGNVFVMVNDQQESVANSGDVDKYKQGPDYKNSVDFDVSYASASSLNLSIDLNSIKQGDENTKSANDSTLLNTMQVSMNGKTYDAKETNNTDSNLETFYGQVAKNAHGAKNNDKIYTALSSQEISDAINDKSNPDVQATQSILDSMKQFLENLQAENAQKNPQYEYTLNMTWEEFQDLYGKGFNGKYLKGVIDVGEAQAKKWAYQKDDGFHSAEFEDTGKAMDEYNEKNKVKVVKKTKTTTTTTETTNGKTTTTTKTNDKEDAIPANTDTTDKQTNNTSQTDSDFLNKDQEVE